MFALKKFPAVLVKLLTDPTIIRLGFNWGNDLKALSNTWSILTRVPGLDADLYVIVKVLYDNRQLAESMFGDTVGTILDGGLSLTDLEVKFFGSIWQKPIWRGQFLNRPLKDIFQDGLDHMARDAVGHFDIFLALQLCHSALLHFRNRLASHKQWRQFRLPAVNLWDQIIPPQ